MAHYEQIGRKSVVNFRLATRKANKINGLILDALHRRELGAPIFYKVL